MGPPGRGPGALRIRCATVARVGSDDFVLVTSLTDADRDPAADIPDADRLRGSIETLFQHAVQTFQLRRLIGGSPDATVFQAIVALLLSNVTHAVRDAAADAVGGGDVTPADLFLARLFDDTRRDLIGLFRMVDPGDVVAVLGATPGATAAALREHLRRLLRGRPPGRDRKPPTREGVPKPTNRGYVCGGHASVDKVARGDIAIVPIKDAKTKPRYAKKKTPRMFNSLARRAAIPTGHKPRAAGLRPLPWAERSPPFGLKTPIRRNA